MLSVVLSGIWAIHHAWTNLVDQRQSCHSHDTVWGQSGAESVDANSTLTCIETVVWKPIIHRKLFAAPTCLNCMMSNIAVMAIGT